MRMRGSLAGEASRKVRREHLESWCETGSLVLVGATLAFGPLATGAVLPWQFAVLEFLAAGALALWLLRLWLNPGCRLLWPPVAWLVAGFLAYALVRYRGADLEWIARRELGRVIVYGAVFFILLNNLSRKVTGKVFVYLLLAVAMVVAVYGIYQYATESPRVWHYLRPKAYGRRASGTYICPNHYAGFLAMALPAGLALTLVGKAGPVQRIVAGYGCLVALIGLGFSFSRGGWLAAAVGVAGVLCFAFRQRRLRLMVVLAALIVCLLGMYGWSRGYLARRRVQEVFEGPGPQQTLVVRSSIWQSAYRMWRDHPWFGVGPGHFDFRFPAYRSPLIQARPLYAHNDYLNTLADWGVVGAGLIVLALGWTAAGARRSLRFFLRQSEGLETKPSDRLALTVGAGAGWLVVLAHALIDFNMQIPANALVAVAYLAILAQQLRFTKDRYWVNLRWLGRAGLTLGGTACALWLWMQGWQQLREEVWLSRAAAAKPASQARIQALRQAVAIEPANGENLYALGEAFRLRSWAGNLGYERDADEAIRSFEEGSRLNPYDPYCLLRLGMCWDWLGRHGQAAPYYDWALGLDPNNYYLVAHKGWHYVQVGDLPKALEYFEQSLALKLVDNIIARHYKQIIQTRLQEEAARKAKAGP
jgi:O-antigen ligase